MRGVIRAGIVAGVLVAVAAAAPSAAFAGEGALVTPAEREAQVRFEEGLARVKAGNFEGARMSFTQAYAVLHKPHILWNLALAEEKAGHPLEALGHFKQFVSLSQASDDRASAEKHIAELTGQVGHLDVAAPAGASIAVDGAPAGAAPWSEALDVSPGRHHVEVRAGAEVKEADPDVPAGQVIHVSLGLPADIGAGGGGGAAEGAAGGAPSSGSPAAAAGSVEANGAPGSETPAPHKSGDTSVARVLTVVGVGTVAAVSIALGAYFALQSQSERDTASSFRNQYPSDYCTSMPGTSTCAQWNDAVQSQNRDAMLSTGLYVAGGVVAAGALAAWLLWPSAPPSASAMHWVPVVGTGQAGLAAAGRF